MSSPTNQTLLERLDRCPPFLVYYGFHLLRDHQENRPTVQDLVRISGLPLRTLTRAAHRTSWAGVKVQVMDRLCRACQVNPLEPEPLLAAVAAEIREPVPFPELANRRRRKKMLAAFDLLCTKLELTRAG